jgi:hypothetical protein
MRERSHGIATRCRSLHLIIGGIFIVSYLFSFLSLNISLYKTLVRTLRRDMPFLLATFGLVVHRTAR